MKASNYNFFFPFELDSSKIVAYNSMTNALALLDKEHYKIFTEFVDNNVPIENENFLSQLKHGGYLVDSEVNELSMIKFINLKSKFSTKNLNLTIAPTIDCNFDCTYCYEKANRKKSHMPESIQEKIVAFVKNNIPYIDSLTITWYGGEPLLELETIESISRRLIDICSQEKIHYLSSIVTNGYLLTPNIAARLKSININSVQVTLDGSREIHDKRRPLAGGKGTFDKILSNVITCAHIIPIALRVNTDKENVNSINDITEILNNSSAKDKLFIYLGYVEPTNNCYMLDKCMDYSDFSKLSLDFNRSLLDKGFIKNPLFKYPQAKGTHCCADAYNTFVIDPDGYLYKCWSDIGIKENAIGSLVENNSIKSNAFSKLEDYLLYDFTSDSECIECKFLPMCLGGCPRKRLDKICDRCSEYKYTIEQYLRRAAVDQYSILFKSSD